MQSIRAENLTHSGNVKYTPTCHVLGHKCCHFKMLTKCHEFNFKKIFHQIQHVNTRFRESQGREMNYCSWLLLSASCRKQLKAKLKPKLKLKLAHIQKHTTGHVEFRMNHAKCFKCCLQSAPKKKREKLEEGVFLSLFLPFSLLCPSHVFNKYHNEEVKRQQQRQQLKHLALS